ncbi:MAG: nicotinate-nucleotide adenylyltransferase [Rubrivivax sp.]
MKRERLGLFGGSFDPVHRAHLALAQAARAELGLDRVLWIPAGQPWQKVRPMTAAAHRLAMLQLALAGEAGHAIDRREIERPGPTFTVDTVDALHAEHPDAELFLLIGQDQYAAFHTWHRWRDIVRQVVLAVAQRPGTPTAADPEVERAPMRPVPLPPMDVAATTIRERVAAARPIDDLVPAQVARYIESQGLYRPGPPVAPRS